MSAMEDMPPGPPLEELDERPSKPVLKISDHVDEAPQWERKTWDMLEMVKRGEEFKPRACFRNVVTVLEYDSRWAGRFERNAFDQLDTLDREPVRDETESAVKLWMSEIYEFDPAFQDVGRAISYVAHRNQYHPVREYLDGLQWDGKPRVDTMLSTVFGASDEPTFQRVGACFMISAVARVMRPGCKVDTTLILVGGQGAGKSTACRLLSVRPDWFSDTLIDIRSKDLFEGIQGVWLYELAELDSLRRAEWPKVKAILSSPRDRWRRPYGKRTEAIERQVVFIGTTNADEFLGDPTGSRRFWPVRCGTVDVEALAGMRDQLWAEAVHRFRQDEPWWLSREEAEEMARLSEEFAESDAWEQPVTEWATKRAEPFTLAELMGQALDMSQAEMHRSNQMRVAAILTQIGFTKVRTRVNGERITKWERA